MRNHAALFPENMMRRFLDIQFLLHHLLVQAPPVASVLDFGLGIGNVGFYLGQLILHTTTDSNDIEIYRIIVY